jgi:hypothetical protein
LMVMAMENLIGCSSCGGRARRAKQWRTRNTSHG